MRSIGRVLTEGGSAMNVLRRVVMVVFGAVLILTSQMTYSAHQQPTRPDLFLEFDYQRLAIANLEGEPKTTLADNTWRGVPTVSPNAKWIALGLKDEIVLFDRRGNQHKTLAKSTDSRWITEIGFSLDSQWLLYRERKNHRWGNVYRVRLDEDYRENLTADSGEHAVVFWMPDFERLLVYREDSDEAYCVSVSDGTRTKLQIPVSSYVLRYGTGYGEWVAMRRSQPDGTSSVVLTRLDCTEQRLMPRIVGQPWAWTPDGEWLLYNANYSGYQHIYRVRPDGSDLQNLTAQAQNNETLITLSPNAAWLYFYVIHSDSTKSLYRMRLDGSERQLLTPGLRDVTFKDWSSDGEWLFIQDRNDGVTRLYRLRRDGSARQEIAHRDEALWTVFTELSPDGKWLLTRQFLGNPEQYDYDFWQMENRHYRMVMRADGSDQRRLTNYSNRFQGWLPPVAAHEFSLETLTAFASILIGLGVAKRLPRLRFRRRKVAA